MNPVTPHLHDLPRVETGLREVRVGLPESDASVPALLLADGRVLTRWTPTSEERSRLLAGVDLWVTLWSDGVDLSPVLLTVGPPELPWDRERPR